MEKFSIEMPKDGFGDDSKEFRISLKNWRDKYPELQFRSHGGSYGLIEIIGMKKDLEKWINKEGFSGWDFEFEPLNENKEIKTEAFSESLPDWLKSKLNKNSLTKYNKYSSGRSPIMDLAWDKIKYIPAEIPQNARAKDLKDDNKLPVFRLAYPYSIYNSKDVRDYVYIPGLIVPSIDGNFVNMKGYDIPLSRVSYKQLLPYIKEFGYLDLTDASTLGLKADRRKSREGSIERDRNKGLHPHREYIGNGKYSDDVTWVTDKGFDKSGYPLDPQRQVKKLAQMSLKDADSAADRIEKIYNDIEAVRIKIGKVLSEKTINDLKGNSDVEKWDTKMYRIERAVRYLDDAVKSYTNILKTLDEAKESDENWINSWLSREFKRDMLNIKDNLKECNACLNEFEETKTEGKKLQENETDGYRAVAIMDANSPKTFYGTIMLNNKHTVNEFQKVMNQAYDRNKEEIMEYGNDLEVVLGDIDESFDWYEIPTDDDYLTI